MQLVWVTEARYLADYKMMLVFNDGLQKVFDFSKLLNDNQKAYDRLKDMAVFKDFELDGWTVTWLNGRLDIAPEYLYNN